MNYGVGDTVVCIDALPVEPDTELTVGEKYKVAWVNGDAGCVELDGMYALEPVNTKCDFCGSTSPLEHYATWRFVKVDGVEVTARTSQETSEVV